MAWHKRKYASLALRLAGCLLLGLAALIARNLFAAPDPAAKLRAAAYLLALAQMVTLSAGAGLAVLGRHLFDQVELPARWRIHPPPQPRSARLSERDVGQPGAHPGAGIGG
jgi:hypothetical protein